VRKFGEQCCESEIVHAGFGTGSDHGAAIPEMVQFWAWGTLN